MKLPVRALLLAAATLALASLTGARIGIAANTGSDIYTVTVDARGNVFAAGVGGLKANGGGHKPTVVSFEPLNRQTVVFTSVLGNISCCGSGNTFNGPGGGTNGGGSTDIQSSGGISGIINHTRTMFLVGVFLGYPGPAAPGPERRDVTYDPGKPDLYPQLDQTFYIGTGKVLGSGAYQRFHVPQGANRLVLGFADAFSFHGKPGYYDDNVGQLTTKFRIISR
jgi:hypothetical protein